MQLEQIIKQTKPFKSEVQKMMIHLQVTASAFNYAMTKELKAFDITPPQYNVLRILKGKYPDCYCNMDITERMIDKSSNCTRIVDKLCDKELISRKTNKIDKRGVDITITKKGLLLLEKIDLASNPIFKKLLTFDNEKAVKMNQMLDELREILTES